MNETKPGQGGNKGVRVEASILNENGKLALGLRVRNLSGRPLSGFMAQIKPNYFGLTLEKIPETTLNDQESREIKVNIGKGGNRDTNLPKPPLLLTVGFKNNLDIFYFDVPCMFHVLLVNYLTYCNVIFFRRNLVNCQHKTLNPIGNKFQTQMSLLLMFKIFQILQEILKVLREFSEEIISL